VGPNADGIEVQVALAATVSWRSGDVRTSPTALKSKHYRVHSPGTEGVNLLYVLSLMAARACAWLCLACDQSTHQLDFNSQIVFLELQASQFTSSVRPRVTRDANR
jgi:hypothetical protein